VDLSAVRDRVARAVDGHGRTLVLQPIVDVRAGRAFGAEALTRFAGGPERPDLWFAEADRVGLRVPLELAAAADALAVLAGRRAPGYVSVNLSPDVLVQADLGELLCASDPARVVVEVTEHAPVADYAALAAALAPWRRRGLRLAVDDAGAGYASMRHIVQLAPDLIKLDMSLVRGIDADPATQALAASLAHFAGATGAQLVAEGVETRAEYDEVARLGVVLAQGHLLARPAATWRDDPYPRPDLSCPLSAG
jgi:EAL domain-containing protein (putative c-di-GMP-specific phosphodiesterase class I)